MSEKLEEIIIFGNETIRNCIKKLNVSGKKTLIVINKKNQLIGALSDGDIRKAIIKNLNLSKSIKNIFQRKPIFLVDGLYNNEDVKNIFSTYEVNLIPIVNKNKKLLDCIFPGYLYGNKNKLKTKSNLPVVIMAGGKGQRMKPFTDILPKPLLPVNNKTVIDNIINNFANYGINNFFITLNYKNRIIKAYIDETYKNNDNIKINYVDENKPLGTIGSLRLIKKNKNKDFVVTNCDVIFFIDYNSLFNFHFDSKNDITFVVSRKQLTNPYGVCKKDKNNNFLEIIEKPTSYHLINVGFYIIRSSLISLIPKDTEFNATDLIKKAKQKNKKIGIFPISEDCWSDIGQWDEYNDFIKKNE